jgi:hypothetical protein
MRLSLNNRMLTAIRRAIDQDELGPTNTQFDIFNAISRVATHNEALTFRQRRTLSQLAGKFSQQDVHKCDKCAARFYIIRWGKQPEQLCRGFLVKCILNTNTAEMGR